MSLRQFLDKIYSGIAHHHNGLYLTRDEVRQEIAFSPSNVHDHDDFYYTETETDALLALKADDPPINDGRYYTETEVDSLLGGKSDTGHTHAGGSGPEIIDVMQWEYLGDATINNLSSSWVDLSSGPEYTTEDTLTHICLGSLTQRVSASGGVQDFGIMNRLRVFKGGSQFHAPRIAANWSRGDGEMRSTISWRFAFRGGADDYEVYMRLRRLTGQSDMKWECLPDTEVNEYHYRQTIILVTPDVTVPIG